MILSNKIDFRGKSKQDIITFLKQHKFDEEGKGYDYLLNLNFWNLSKEYNMELDKKIKQNEQQIIKLEGSTPAKLWEIDLDMFEESWKAFQLELAKNKL